MVFWTWARGLEDEFDGKNRKNPRHFLVSRPNSRRPQSIVTTEENKGSANDDIEDITEAVEMHGVPTLSHRGLSGRVNEDDARVPDSLTFVDDKSQEEMGVVRIPTAAVFHKLTAGKGVPHAFYGFIKQMPALPRLVVRTCFIFLYLWSKAHLYSFIDIPFRQANSAGACGP